MKMAILIVLCMICGNIYAGEETTNINRLGAATDQYAVMVVDTPLPTKPPCAEGNTVVSFDKSTPHGKDMFALAMTALATDKKLVIYYSETSCGLYSVRTLVNRIDIVK
jgi:hypothetical protein